MNLQSESFVRPMDVRACVLRSTKDGSVDAVALAEELNNMPTYDPVYVAGGTRCHDCMHYTEIGDTFKNNKKKDYLCLKFNMRVEGGGFCGYGQKKKEDTEE